MKNYVSITQIIEESPQTTLFNFVGKRGCGKTFGAKQYCLEHFIETGRKFLYVRRSKSEIKEMYMKMLFDEILEKTNLGETLIEKYNLSEPLITYYRGSFWVCDYDEKNRIIEIGRGWSVDRARQIKGLPINGDTDVIVFDEVITDAGYINRGLGEPNEFDKIVKTVGRNRVRILLIGNPDMNVEQCPYFYNLKIDYKNLEPNKIYYFNSHYKSNIAEKNICFVKLAGSEDDGFIPLTNAGLFGVVEDMMSLTGEVTTQSYKNLARDEIKRTFTPELRIKTETAVITKNGHHKCVYAYIGLYHNTPMLLITGNDVIRSECFNLLSLYDNQAYSTDNFVYRLNFQPYPTINRILNDLIAKNSIITDDDYNATTWFNIYNEKKG